MIPNPILKVLSSMRAHRVRALLMGGQACVFYGAAEFSRDSDFAVLADESNFRRLTQALGDLHAEPIAVPPCELKFLRRGHALHYRCQHPDAPRMRVDVMSKMRGVDSFPRLWRRRTTIQLPGGTKCDLLSLPDLVKAKKTQRDKDWPMVRRLVEAHYFSQDSKPSAATIEFWLRELRTAELLLEVARDYTPRAMKFASRRRLLHAAILGDLPALEHGLRIEENRIRMEDKEYWKPLKQELQKLRHAS